MRGLDELFYMPHSRHTTVSESEINAHPQLEVLARADKTGVGIARSYDNKHVFIFGHPEYDRDTLYQEYDRDRKLGLEIEIPENYFPDDDPTKEPIIRWRSASTRSVNYNRDRLKKHIYKTGSFNPSQYIVKI